MRVVRRLGYGARSSVYEVVLGSGQHAAMKYLIQNTERNRERIKFEYDIIKQLRQQRLSQRSFDELRSLMPDLRESLEELNRDVIGQSFPEVYEIEATAS